MEALITLNCSDYSKSMLDILKIFQQIGWDIYNLQGKVEYLPVNDDGMYNWQSDKISESELYDIVSEKIVKKEQIGVNLFYKNGKEGITLMAYTTDEVMLSLSVNRKVIGERHTDSIWYLENIIYKFLKMGIRLLSYKLEEYED